MDDSVRSTIHLGRLSSIKTDGSDRSRNGEDKYGRESSLLVVD